jgi:hypothetical protein
MNVYVDAMEELKKEEMAKYIAKREDFELFAQGDLNSLTVMKKSFINT